MTISMCLTLSSSYVLLAITITVAIHDDHYHRDVDHFHRDDDHSHRDEDHYLGDDDHPL